MEQQSLLLRLFILIARRQKEQYNWAWRHWDIHKYYAHLCCGNWRNMLLDFSLGYESNVEISRRGENTKVAFKRWLNVLSRNDYRKSRNCNLMKKLKRKWSQRRKCVQNIIFLHFQGPGKERNNKCTNRPSKSWRIFDV